MSLLYLSPPIPDARHLQHIRFGRLCGYRWHPDGVHASKWMPGHYCNGAARRRARHFLAVKRMVNPVRHINGAMWQRDPDTVGPEQKNEAYSDSAARILTRPCRIERLDRAYALLCRCVVRCAGHLAHFEDAIGRTLSGLQAATGPELRALEARYAQSQTALEAGSCRLGCYHRVPGPATRPRPSCRLPTATMSLGRFRLTESLALAADDLGKPRDRRHPRPRCGRGSSSPCPASQTARARRIRVPLVVPVN